MKKKNLPAGWRVVTEEYGGTGHGDEEYLPTLYRWEHYIQTTGHLWWKKRTPQVGWVYKRLFNRTDGLEVIVEYVQDTLRAEKELAHG